MILRKRFLPVHLFSVWSDGKKTIIGLRYVNTSDWWIEDETFDVNWEVHKDYLVQKCSLNIIIIALKILELKANVSVHNYYWSYHQSMQAFYCQILRGNDQWPGQTTAHRIGKNVNYVKAIIKKKQYQNKNKHFIN